MEEILKLALHLEIQHSLFDILRFPKIYGDWGLFISSRIQSGYLEGPDTVKH